jgi:hypothetical protein
MTIHTPPKPAPQVSNHFPPFNRDALLWAGALKDYRMIDAATDELVRLGLCRPRRAAGMFTTRVGAARA